jgi:DNA-binding LytR/AlgR family response regulator
MTARGTPDQKAVGREISSEQSAHAKGDVAAHPLREDAIVGADARDLIGALRQLEGIAHRQTARIAFKAKGRILFLDLAEIAAVEAEGNYVSLRHRPNTYLLHESLSSMAEKLKPFGFIRIHRSVVVNISAVKEIQPLPTGEYRLRVKGGEVYLVTRTYKDNLRDLAQLWVGSETRKNRVLTGH